MRRSIFYFLAATAVIISSCGGPKAIFSVEPDGTKAPLRVGVINNSTDADSYEWDFGDGFRSVDSLPEHRYLNSGRYVVKLKVKKGKKVNVKEQELIVQPPDECLVYIKTTEGDMIARLFDETPKHRDNFIKLANEGYYDGLLFHRVIDGFMIQGGDPKSKAAKKGASYGAGGPGYTIEAEFRESLAHVKGALAAARTENPEKESSGSQYYIVHGKEVTEADIKRFESKNGITYPPNIKKQYLELGGTPFLDQGYTVFGIVIEGLDVIDKIAEKETGKRDRPIEDVKMEISVIK